MGGLAMRQETIEAVVLWQRTRDDGKEPLDITFHGGEPLLPGIGFYQAALPALHKGLAPRQVKFSMQSNLWLLTDELCHLFFKNNLSLGTSLDGPEEINDAQRGQGYFRKTMAGIERARTHGLDVSCICTFTAQSVSRMPEIFNFFIQEGLNFTIHAALPSLRFSDDDQWSLPPTAHGQVLVAALENYLSNLSKVRISTLDLICRGISEGYGQICTFSDCLGNYLAVGPDGAIYPCQRFAGMPEYQLGNIHELPTQETISAASAWQTFQARQEHIQAECGECPHLNYCRGGCPYNILAANSGCFDGKLRDPHCDAYRSTFGYIIDRAVEEVFSHENMDAVVSQPGARAGLLQKGKLLSIMHNGPHPYESARHARKILAAVILAITRDPLQTARHFEGLGLVGRYTHAQKGISALYRHLTTPSTSLNNLYLHITFACPLRCSHCYARGGEAQAGSLPIADIQRACLEAAQMGFRHAVITGGEPLVHPQHAAMLDMLAGSRSEVKPLLTVLRTSLALPLDDGLLRLLAYSTDEIVVSVDGDEETHDLRRGAGSYALTVANLRALAQLNGTTELSLAAVLPLQQSNGAPGEAVRALASELGIRRTRFRPLLPLGRAVDSALEIVPETLWGHIDPRQMVDYGFSPVASCGIGQNLYIEPDGAAYPCYAWHGEHWRLGAINDRSGLAGVISTSAFQDLRAHNVNTNLACRECALRYLCGGACRAWNRLPADQQMDVDAPPRDCAHLRQRAHALFSNALASLEISEEQWLAAGLPQL